MLKKTILTVATFCLMVSNALSQDFPSQPVKLIVPYTAGGSIDTVGRELGKALSDELGHTFIIENKPGASANIGANFVANAKPDGHTLLVSAATTLAAAPSLFKELTYDPINDLVPIALVSTQPNVLVVHPSTNTETIQEFIQRAQAKPEDINVGIVSIGGPQHMSTELFMHRTDTELTIVPYKGGSEAMLDLVA